MDSLTKSRIEAIVRLFVPLIVAVLAKFGIDADTSIVFDVGCVVVTLGIMVWCWWWKNNSITPEAVAADSTMKWAKSLDMSKEEKVSLEAYVDSQTPNIGDDCPEELNPFGDNYSPMDNSPEGMYDALVGE